MNRREVAIAGHTGDVATARAALTDADPAIRSTALGALHRQGELTLEELTVAFKDARGEVRRRAAEVAAAYPVSLLGLLHDDDPAVIEVAAFACGEHESVDDEVLMRLVWLATDHEDSLVRESAVAALGAIGDPRGLMAILAGCRDKPAIRRRAVLALAPFEGAEVEAALSEALLDRDWQVRQAAEDLLR